MKTFEQFLEGYFSELKSNYNDPPPSEKQTVDISNHFAGIKTVEIPVKNRKFIKSEDRIKWEKTRDKYGIAPGSVEPDEKLKDLVGTVEYEGKNVDVRWNPVFKVWQGRL